MEDRGARSENTTTRSSLLPSGSASMVGRSQSGEHGGYSQRGHERGEPGCDRPDCEGQGERAVVAGSGRECVDIRCGGKREGREGERGGGGECCFARRVCKSKVFEADVKGKRKGAYQPRGQPP